MRKGTITEDIQVPLQIEDLDIMNTREIMNNEQKRIQEKKGTMTIREEKEEREDWILQEKKGLIGTAMIKEEKEEREDQIVQEKKGLIGTVTIREEKEEREDWILQEMSAILSESYFYVVSCN